MDERKRSKKSNEEKQIKKSEQVSITYSTSNDTELDLLEIIEMYLCKSCIKL